MGGMPGYSQDFPHPGKHLNSTAKYNGISTAMLNDVTDQRKRIQIFNSNIIFEESNLALQL